MTDPKVSGGDRPRVVVLRSSGTTRRSRVSPQLERPKPKPAEWRPPPASRPGRALSPQELNVLIPGFRTIRDQEPLDDVADWANAVVALLEDEAHRNPAG